MVKKDTKKLSFIIILLIIFNSLPYFIGIWVPDVKDKDEAIYAEISREMVESHNYWDTNYNYKEWFQHPPMTMWLISLSYHLFGINPFGVRFPSAFFSILALILVYYIGKEFTSSKISGLFASLVLVSSPAYHLMVRDAKLDMVLLFFITLSFFFYVFFLKRRQTIYIYLLFLSMSLAFLTKGPIGIIFPSLPILFHYFINRKKIKLPPVSVAASFILMVIVIFPWYYHMYEKFGFSFLRRIFFQQNLSRYFTTNYTGRNSPLYYFHTFAWAFLPYLVPFLVLFGSIFQEYKKNNAFIIPILWFVIPFVLMSFSHSKLPQYIFPILPAASLLTGNYLSKVIERKPSFSFLYANFLIFILLLSFFVVINLIFFPSISIFLFIFILSLSLIFFSFSIFALRVRSFYLLVILISLVMGSFHFSINFHVDPEILKYQPSSYFAKKVRENHLDSMSVYTYKFSPKPSLIFYFRKKIGKFNLRNQLYPSRGIIIFPREKLKNLKRYNLRMKFLSVSPYYPTSRISLKFLSPKDRKKVCKDILLCEFRIENNPKLR